MLNTILYLGVAVCLGWWWLESKRRKRHPVSPGYQANIQFPHEHEFELYHNALSLCSMKTRICLAELGISYHSHHIDLIETGSYESLRSHLLAVNPAGTVPVLVHNGHPVYESHEQIRYAAQHAPAGSAHLVPEDPELRMQMEQWVDATSLTSDPLNEMEKSAGNAVPGLTLPLFSSMIKRVAYWKIAEGLLFHFDKIRPVLFMTLKLVNLKNFHHLKPVMNIYKKGRLHMGTHLDRLEEQLNSHQGSWILGDQFTLADVSWLVIFERFKQADCLDLFLGNGQRPACHRYWQQLQKRPSYAEAIQSHSHPTIAYGTQRLKDVKGCTPKLDQALGG